MKRTSFEDWDCSIARTLEIIGEVWTPLILRDLFWGLERFDDLLEDLGISRNILADRLRTLVAAEVVEKVPYQDRPVRHRYRLTEKGRELWPVLASLLAWGDRWTVEPGQEPVRLRHAVCGEHFHAEPVCSSCGEHLVPRDITFEFRTTPQRLLAES